MNCELWAINQIRFINNKKIKAATQRIPLDLNTEQGTPINE